MTFKKIIKNKWFITMVMFVVLLTAISTVTHEYGPYYGKVVDAETKSPIEGAVVVVVFLTEGHWSPGGAVSHFVDVKETVTDAKGEFRIPATRYFRYRVLNVWDPYPMVHVIKSGYGCFPFHRKVERIRESGNTDVPGWTILSNDATTVMLPALKSFEERNEELTSCHLLSTEYINVPLYTKEINEERKYLGYEPYVLKGGK